MVIPSTLLRTAAVYRSWGAPGQRLGVGFWVAPRSWVEPRRRGAFWALGLVLRGSGRFDGAPLAAGTAYVRRPGARHDFSVDGGYAECWIDLGGPLAGLPGRLGLTDADRPSFTAGIDLALVRRWDALLAAAQAASAEELPVVAAEVIAVAAAVVAAAARSAPDPHGALIAEACALLDGGAGPARLARLAQVHGLSFERLRKVFRARTGSAPGTYRRRRRMDRARELLREGMLGVAEVAHAVGYASAATFSLQFKADAGMPPAAWRRGQGR